MVLSLTKLRLSRLSHAPGSLQAAPFRVKVEKSHWCDTAPQPRRRLTQPDNYIQQPQVIHTKISGCESNCSHSETFVRLLGTDASDSNDSSCQKSVSQMRCRDGGGQPPIRGLFSNLLADRAKGDARRFMDMCLQAATAKAELQKALQSYSVPKPPTLPDILYDDHK